MESLNTGEPICRNPMEPREEEDRSPERSLWADPDHKVGFDNVKHKDRGEKLLLRSIKKKDEQQKFNTKKSPNPI